MARAKDPQRQTLILDTALELFARRGFHAVSVKDIAAAADISLGSLYTYFASKEQLGNVLFRHWKHVFAEVARRDVDGKFGRDAHRAMWDNVGQFIQAYPRAFAFLEAQLHATYLDAESVAIEHTLTQSAIAYYLDRLQLPMTMARAQLLISATFGAYVQVFKAAQAGLLPFDAATLASLESMAWSMTST